MVTLDFDAPNAYDPVLAVGGCDETSNVWPESADRRIDIGDPVFDGALWAEKDYPADPFAQPVPVATEQKYVILDTRQIVGNCAMFWRPDGAGYTCDLNDAGLYDKTRSRRDTDIYVPIEAARLMAVTHVRVEPLKQAGYWPKPPVIKREPQRCEGCPRFVKQGGWLCPKCFEKETRKP